MIEHKLPCGHVVRVSYAWSSPALVEARRRHARTCGTKVVVAGDPAKIRRFTGVINGECLMGHARTPANTYTDADGVEWCRTCSRNAQNGEAA